MTKIAVINLTAIPGGIAKEKQIKFENPINIDLKHSKNRAQGVLQDIFLPVFGQYRSIIPFKTRPEGLFNSNRYLNTQQILPAQQQSTLSFNSSFNHPNIHQFAFNPPYLLRPLSPAVMQNPITSNMLRKIPSRIEKNIQTDSLDSINTSQQTTQPKIKQAQPTSKIVPKEQTQTSDRSLDNYEEQTRRRNKVLADIESRFADMENMLKQRELDIRKRMKQLSQIIEITQETAKRIESM